MLRRDNALCSLACFLCLSCLGIVLPLHVGAQTNTHAVRLGVVLADSTLGAQGDLLTAQFTKLPGLELLERAEIDRLRKEQSLSALNKDNLKLGQILGADGLLLLDTAREGSNQFLTARLIAVKPGVVIGAERFPWPLPDVNIWSQWMSNRFGPLMPKLGVLAKDAIPISVVNLHSAFAASANTDAEQQLTALLVERLTRETNLFVLERRRMELVDGRKGVKGFGTVRLLGWRLPGGRHHRSRRFLQRHHDRQCPPHPAEQRRPSGH